MLADISQVVIYEDRRLIAFNKPPCIPVQKDETGDPSLRDLASRFAGREVGLVHRLDRPASGVVVFAKDKEMLASLSKQFADRHVKKTYLAVVKNLPPTMADRLTGYIRKNGGVNRSDILTDSTPGTNYAELSYRVIGSVTNYHVLEINLVTGRHHQIRAQLGAMGCPIKGDVKYGFRRANRNRAIHLHAWKVELPTLGIEIKAPLPDDDAIWLAVKAFLGEDY